MSPLSGFEHPALMVFVCVPMALAVLYGWSQIRRRQRMKRFVDPELAGSVSPRRPARLRHVPAALLAVALVFLTVAMAGPTRDTRIPVNRAVVMLAIDVSQSMRADDVPPTRLAAAQQAAKRFAQQLTPGVNLGLVSFAGTANLLVSPTPDHRATVAALDNLRPDDSTAIGEAVFTALQSITTVSTVLTSADAMPPPARLVLLSDGKENKPSSPDNVRGAYTAARTARTQRVPISTISFGTDAGIVAVNNQRLPVPVDPDMLRKVAQLSGGQSYTATNVDELNRSYTAVQDQVGYRQARAPAPAGWVGAGLLLATLAAALALAVNRRLPT